MQLQKNLLSRHGLWNKLSSTASYIIIVCFCCCERRCKLNFSDHGMRQVYCISPDTFLIYSAAYVTLLHDNILKAYFSSYTSTHVIMPELKIH